MFLHLGFHQNQGKIQGNNSGEGLLASSDLQKYVNIFTSQSNHKLQGFLMRFHLTDQHKKEPNDDLKTVYGFISFLKIKKSDLHLSSAPFFTLVQLITLPKSSCSVKAS
ncbi:hypothetical protein AMECASPLE_010207 [Ameca splendens]|uniref:Uncharacterized protein n=1 Tax=Ameca splendens TaxID=208324 RepID=A0ABV0XDH5_9TELE